MATYIVTGANRGLGLEFVRQLLAGGHAVWALCRDPAAAEGLRALEASAERAGTGASLTIRAGDVQDEASLEAALEGLEAADVLINNAGVAGKRGGGLGEMDLADAARTFDINVLGIARMTRVARSRLAKGEGKLVVNISSLMGSVSDNGSGGAYGYRISKAAVNMLTRNLAHELGELVVVALHPGWVQTDMGGASAPLTPTDSIASMLAAMGRMREKDSGGFFDRSGDPLAW